MCLRKLTIVNDTLEALGAPKEYQRLRNWIIRIIIGMIVYFFYAQAFPVIYTVIFYSNFFNYIIFYCMALVGFLMRYPIYIIILSNLISSAIFGLVLYICTHLFL